MSTESKLAIERLKMREEMKSIPEDELSDLIEREAPKRLQTTSSTPAPAKGLVAVLNTKPSLGAIVVVLAVLALAAFAIARGAWPGSPTP